MGSIPTPILYHGHSCCLNFSSTEINDGNVLLYHHHLQCLLQSDNVWGGWGTHTIHDGACQVCCPKMRIMSGEWCGCVQLVFQCFHTCKRKLTVTLQDSSTILDRFVKNEILNWVVMGTFLELSSFPASGSFSDLRTSCPVLQDTAGQERFHALGPIYYRDADGSKLQPIGTLSSFPSFLITDTKQHSQCSSACLSCHVLLGSLLASQ